jgi:hypothetical protein
MEIPREIFILINAKSVALFSTCKNFNQFIDVFYRTYTVDTQTNSLVDYNLKVNEENLKILSVFHLMTDSIVRFINLICCQILNLLLLVKSFHTRLTICPVGFLIYRKH